MDLHVFPIPIPPPTSLSTQSLWVFPLHLKTTERYRLKVKGWKKIFYANGDQKKAGVAIFISEILIVCNILIFQKYIQKATEKSPACFDTSVMCQNRTFSSSEMFAEIMRLG